MTGSGIPGCLCGIVLECPADATTWSGTGTARCSTTCTSSSPRPTPSGHRRRTDRDGRRAPDAGSVARSRTTTPSCSGGRWTPRSSPSSTSSSTRRTGSGWPSVRWPRTPLAALRAWPGTQSLLSMWFHDELVPAVERYGLTEHLPADRRAACRRRRGPEGGVPCPAPGRRRHPRAVGGAHRRLAGRRRGGRVVGARCVLYTGGITDPERLRASGAPVADSLSEAVALAAGWTEGGPAGARQPPQAAGGG